MANSLKTHIENLLKTDERLIDENNELRGSLIRELANKLDEKLIELLLTDEKARNTFFLRIKGMFVFKHNDFKFFLDENKIDNSYTQYENRIGLAVGSKMLNENQDVVLNFPYKDCVLEGGQSTEEGMDTYFEFNQEKAEYEEKQAKRKEIFFNEVLARDEIDRLFEPKAFTNIKKYTQKGVEIPTKFIRNENGVIKDNLIIKGNNLLALHSLKKEFKGQVKLIGIDPPYNTGSDSFIYNDSFNHSTWLTFMKNRVLAAKALMCPSAIFYTQCSFHQFAYLKVLLNDIFEKHLCDFVIQVRHPDRALTGDKEFNDVIEYILIYSNDINKKMPFKEELKTIDDYTLEVNINADAVPEKIQFDNKLVEVYTPDKYKVEIVEPNKDALKKISIRGSIREKNSSGRFFVKHLEGLVGYPPETLFKVPDMGDDAINHRYFYSAPKGNKNGGYFQGMPTSSDSTRKQYPNFYNFEKEYNNVSKQGGVEFRNGKKPEELLMFLIELFSNKNEMVLDFHLGSGTTAAVCHKIGRQYIGVEQMQNQIDLSLKRLNNVIQKDGTGISTTVNWKGGGSFVYLELAKNNEQAKELILECESYEELLRLFDVLFEEFFLHYNVRIKEFKEKVCKEENFIKLPLLKQKEMFCKMLDLNQMYVNVSEMEDKRYKLSASDISLTKDFYQIKD